MMNRRKIKYWLGCLAVIGLGAGVVSGAEMLLVEKGVSHVPIIVAADAPLTTTEAAHELAAYIQKISGAKLQILVGPVSPTPERAIWIGIQPNLKEVFPDASLEFTHPEEILQICNGHHLLIAGRDHRAGDKQIESGTANSVYTFLQKDLGVRWLWPGPLGEDVVKRETIAFAPFEYRFTPPFRQRDLFYRPSGVMLDWNRFQRCELDSFWVSADHGFPRWWDDYHKEHPDYFALQPDGTRSGYPSPDTAKLCEANPDVWRQWLTNATEAFKHDPTLQTFPASANDGSNSGICVCDRCTAWDHPDGSSWLLYWEGSSQEHVAMSDRYVTFWNHLARGLKQRFPKRDLYVAGMAYGPSKPAPIAAKLEPNIVIGYVGHFPFAPPAARRQEKEQWQAWAKAAPLLIYRPNLFYYSGGWHGLPTLVLDDTIEDFRFLAEHSGVGITVDGMPNHWATQGPQYYLMAQLAWDPLQDGQAVIQDYYQRGFGPAAEPVRAYFALMEEAHKGILQTPEWRNSMGIILETLTACIVTQYNTARLDEADRLLDEAQTKTVEGSVYRQRVDFVGTGLEFTRLLVDTLNAMTSVRETGGKDSVAVQRAIELCKQRDTLIEHAGGIALNAYQFNTSWRDGRDLSDYLGPPSEAFRKAAGLIGTYRWTGKGNGNLWATTENWERQDGTSWMPAATPPSADDLVVLDDHTAANEPQRIALGRDSTVRRLILDATGARSYHIVSSDAGAQDILDSDSGMLYRLHLADAIPLEQSPRATAALHLEVETLLTAGKPATFLLNSTNGARIVVERTLRTDSTVAISGDKTPSSGLLELRARATASRVFLQNEGRILLNAPGIVVGDTLPSGGTLLLGHDATISSIMCFGGTLHISLFEADSNDVTLTVGELSRGGTLYLDPPADDSSGHLTLKTSSISATGGNVHAPTIHTAANTFVDLTRDQESPMRADLSAGIHGPGGLIKSELGGLNSGPVGLIGDRNTYTGGTVIETGTLKLQQVTIPVDGTIGGAPAVPFAGCLGPGPLHLAANAGFDLNGLTQRVQRLSGAGTVVLNGGHLVVDEPTAKTFSGKIEGSGTLLIAGEKQRSR